MAPSFPLVASHSGARKKRWASPSGDTGVAHHQRDNTLPEPIVSDLETTKQDVPPAPTAMDDVVLPDAGPTRLLTLPFELLHSVATELRGTPAILNLAIVNRHVHGITQQALVKSPLIPKNHIRPFLEMLVKHPDLITRVNSVDLGDYGCGHRTRCSCLGVLNFKPDALKFLSKAIKANSRGMVCWSEIQKARRGPGSVWSRTHAFFLDVLLSLCPNINSIALELPEAQQFDLGHPPSSTLLPPSELPAQNAEFAPVLPFQGPALLMMQANLEVLVVSENSRWKGPVKRELLTVLQDVAWRNMGKHTITLPGFVKLRRLDVPMDVLGRPQNITFQDPRLVKGVNVNIVTEAAQQIPSFVKVLPTTLEYLNLRACNQWSFALLQRLNGFPTESLRLKQVALFFKSCPKTSISLCYAADEGKLNYLHILSELAEKGLNLTFHTGANETTFDMHKELLAMSALSPLEVWRFALWRIQYSDLNVSASIQRRRSVVANHLFMKHAHDFLHLMNSATFKGSTWASVAFFHGIKNTKSDPSVQPQASKTRTIDTVQWESRALGKREPKRRLPALLDITNATFTFQVKQDLTPLPTAVYFLGSTFHFNSGVTSQALDNKSPKSKKKPDSEKTEEKPTKQGHWVDRVEESRMRQEKGIERGVTQMRLDDNCAYTNHVQEVLFTCGSKFQGDLWSGINWKAHLCVSNGFSGTCDGRQ